MNTRRILVAALLASVTCAGGHAADFPIHHAVPDAELDTIRGGYDFGDNLRASFALERTVLVNGVQALRTSISIPDVANITSQQALQLQSALQTTLVNVGDNSVTSSGLASANAAQGAPASAAAAVPGAAVSTVTLPASVSPGLIIQNSLDNQAITATTTIDASVNTARMLQNMRVAESVNDAVVQFRGN